MANIDTPPERWSSRRGFLLAAIGFSVGLGNIWRFPYVVGESGGSAFVIIYLLCAFAIGLVFQTLPLAFGQMAGGRLFGSVFFLLLMVAALSSCLGGAEAVVSWVDERWSVPRKKGVLYFVGTI